ncbi:MAG: UDP-glucose--hexose-1-phosphate uridylyltransferase [Xanthomonadales bacterium]|jgi:UDPglucose--hexose-1-phosphate uridylyltransferase|nr:UDP-glucose--hexose-1-phosphate uridylyltransferase [Xanthomonadales bacterium]
MQDSWTRAHRRYNPLTGEHVLVSPHRLQRPWQGSEEPAPIPASAAYDPACNLCPGNERASGERNPDYAGPFVFDNDFPALPPENEPWGMDEHGLLVARAERGRCRVVCFSPRHDLGLAQLDPQALVRVVEAWKYEHEVLAADDLIGHVQIFENKGELMGCSNPHPHGQIWAQSSIPDLPARELRNMAAWRERHGRPLLMAYAALELERGERLVAVNDHFLVVVPFWATWPFETLVLPRLQVESLADFSPAQTEDFAAIIGVVTRAYDRLFGVPFPYSSGIHQAPTDGAGHPHCTLHMHFYPPLLRSATVRKFMVGYEMLAEAQRDLTPEAGAERLRACLD